MTIKHFRQSDVTRAIRAVQATGAQVSRVEVGADGKIVVVMAAEATVDDTAEKSLDFWREKRDAGSA